MCEAVSHIPGAIPLDEEASHAFTGSAPDGEHSAALDAHVLLETELRDVGDVVEQGGCSAVELEASGTTLGEATKNKTLETKNLEGEKMTKTDSLKSFGCSIELNDTEKSAFGRFNSVQTTASLRDDVASRLQSAKKLGRKRLLKLRGPTLVTATILLLAGFMCWLTSETMDLQWSSGVCMVVLSMPFFFLSLLPSDNRAVRAVLVMIVLAKCGPLLIAVQIALSLDTYDCEGEDLTIDTVVYDVPCWFNQFSGVNLYALNCFFLISIA